MYIFCRRGLASHRRCRLNSNVRHHKMKPVASPAGSAARSAEHQAATARHSREQPTPLVHLHGSGQQDQVKQYARSMKQQVNFPPSQFSASRQAAMALGSGSISQFFGPAASAALRPSFCLVRGSRQHRGASAWPARSGMLQIWSTKVNNTGGTLRTMPLPPTVMPNPSLEARPNIKTPGPRSGRAHFPPRGPGVLLSVPPQLER